GAAPAPALLLGPHAQERAPAPLDGRRVVVELMARVARQGLVQAGVLLAGLAVPREPALAHAVPAARQVVSPAVRVRRALLALLCAASVPASGTAAAAVAAAVDIPTTAAGCVLARRVSGGQHIAAPLGGRVLAAARARRGGRGHPRKLGRSPVVQAVAVHPRPSFSRRRVPCPVRALHLPPLLVLLLRVFLRCCRQARTAAAGVGRLLEGRRARGDHPPVDHTPPVFLVATGCDRRVWRSLVV
ncbi:unnamed protein product, partial [Ectocarpus fasciculatus]